MHALRSPTMRLLVALLSLHLALVLAFTLATAVALAVSRGQRSRPTRTHLTWLVREWLALSWILGTWPLGLWQRAPRSTRSTGRRDPAQLPPAASSAPPVLMVPGYSLNRACFAPLALYLRNRGWAWVWGINNRPASSPVPVLAHHLAERVEQLCEDSGASRVDVVAHSMGGLVAGWYVQRLGGHRRVRRLVTLGTPWAGSGLAVFAFLRQGKDLMPDSEVVAGLATIDEATPRVPTTCIHSPMDNIVLPPQSAVRPGAINVSVPWAGHHALLLSPRVWRKVAQALDTEQHSDSQHPTDPAGR